jgi:hypothetical protein
VFSFVLAGKEARAAWCTDRARYKCIAEKGAALSQRVNIRRIQYRVPRSPEGIDALVVCKNNDEIGWRGQRTSGDQQRCYRRQGASVSLHLFVTLSKVRMSPWPVSSANISMMFGRAADGSDLTMSDFANFKTRLPGCRSR